MKKQTSYPRSAPLTTGILSVLAITAIMVAAAGCTTSRDQAGMPSPESPAQSSAGLSTEPKVLTGAELYAINCNRCHPERTPVEWNAGEWKTILTHMRVRANLPATQARAILDYLQTNSGS